MAETLSDIEALALTCRSDQTKTYIDEALQCYRAGAYRAAIVTTWIAVVFDLIDKIRELSLQGEAPAQNLAQKYDTYIDQINSGNTQGIGKALEFERNILETSRNELQFFDSQQYVDLDRLREDRHRCAHPSFQQIGLPYQPSAEQARLHLRNAIVHVLSQPPLQGKAALAELKVMVSSAYFPNDEEKALKQLRVSSLAAANESLVRNFVDELIFGYLASGESFFFKGQVIAAINAASDMYPAIIEARLRKNLNKVVRDCPDEVFVGAVCLVARLHQGWSVLEESARDKVRAFILGCPADELLPGLEELSEIGELRGTVIERLYTLDLNVLEQAVQSHAVGELAKERVLNLLSQALSWDRVNSVFSKAVFPLFSLLTKEDIIRIIRMPTEHGSDLPGAHGYGIFINKVRDCGALSETELKQLLEENKAEYLVAQINAG